MAEHQIVDLAVAGSNPASHPSSPEQHHGCCNCYGEGPTLEGHSRSPAPGPTYMPKGRTRGTTLPDQDPSGSDEDQDALAKAGERDLEGRDRDLAADVRDREAEQRDREAEARDDAAGDLDRTAGDRAASNRQRAEDAGARAASERADAADSRVRAINDRKVAADDRAHAAKDREDSGTDELTAVRRREAGLAAQDRDVAAWVRDQEAEPRDDAVC